MNSKSKLYKTTSQDVFNRIGHWEVKLHLVYFDDKTLVQIQEQLSFGIGGLFISVNEMLLNIVIE